MADPAPNEDGFSPTRMARAGRRAGKHVAIMEPTSSSSLQQQEAQPSGQQQQQWQRQLSSQGSDRQRQQLQQQQEPQQQQQQQQPQMQPQPPLQLPSQQGPGQQPGASGPPAKRVGFDLTVGSPGADGDGSSGQQQQQRFAGVSRRKQEQIQREETSEAKHRSKYDEKAVEGVVDIPELEEEGKEDITRMVAQAPRGAAQRVQAMSELEQDQGWLPVRPDSDDIDLSLLTACLLPSEQVVEQPDVWDYDLLFSQLKAELQNEGQAGEAGKEEKEELRQI